jgi:hypothetical protein
MISSVVHNNLIEMVEHQNYLIVGFCSPSEGGLHQEIQVYHRPTNAVVFKTIITKQTGGFTPDSFFVRNNMLYFVEERKTLSALHLPTSQDHA